MPPNSSEPSSVPGVAAGFGLPPAPSRAHTEWTSFSHPDPLAEQLQTAQGFLEKIGKGQIRSLFATEEEWLAFHYKEANRFLQFDPVTEEQMAADVLGGYVWLGTHSCACVHVRVRACASTYASLVAWERV